MTEKLQMVEEWILGEMIKPPEKTSGGIFIPQPEENAKKEKTKRVKVLYIGNKVRIEHLEVGDTVMVHQSAGLECEHFGHIFKEGNIMAIVKKDKQDENKD